MLYLYSLIASSLGRLTVFIVTKETCDTHICTVYAQYTYQSKLPITCQSQRYDFLKAQKKSYIGWCVK